jgi:membrane protease YdiL (CAAX protease family)
MKNIWYSIAAFLVLISLMTLLKLSVMFIIRLANIDYENYRQLIIGMAKAISVLVIMLVLIKNGLIKIKTKSQVSLHSSRIFIFIGLNLLVLIHYTFSRDLSIEIHYPVYLNHILPIVIIVPIAEELIYRNGIQELLKQSYNIHFSIFTASFLYAMGYVVLFNFSSAIFIFHFLIGVVLGYCFHYTGSILISISVNLLYRLFVLIALTI